MSRALPTPFRLAAVATVVAAALAAGATGASAAAPAPTDEAGAVSGVAAAPTFETFTSLNLGKNLASNLSGKAVATTPQASTFQQWERKRFFNIASRPGFLTPYQLRNRATQKCLQDAGNGSAVIETTCQTNPPPSSPQLWDNRAASDRTVNGQIFRFRFNRAFGRVLAVAPQFGTTVPVVASADTGSPGSANEALKLWTTRIV